MNEKYSSVEVSKYLLALVQKEGRSLNVTQLQKLLFLTYGVYLAKTNKRLLDEQPKAWPYGPVFPKTQKQKKVNVENKFSLDEIASLLKEDHILGEILKKISKKYSHVSGARLSAWSHEEGAPWDKTVKASDGKWNETIPDDFIYDYFKKIRI